MAKETLIQNRLDDLASAAAIGYHTGWLSDVAQAGPVESALRALASRGAAQQRVADLQRALPAYAQNATRIIGESWAAHVRSRAGRYEDLQALLELLRNLPGQDGTRRILQEALRQLHTLITGSPTDESESELVRAAETVQRALSAAFGDDEVTDFLLACSRAGARLEQLTPTVEAWLASTGVGRLIRIRLGAPQ
jgi:hypothetical protein